MTREGWRLSGNVLWWLGAAAWTVLATLVVLGYVWLRAVNPSGMFDDVPSAPHGCQSVEACDNMDDGGYDPPQPAGAP